MPRLRRSHPCDPGIIRRKRGKGYSYTWEGTGEPVSDPEIITRIEQLVIPPAWTEVWICPWPHGHIQAVGTDAAGRRQYRYHDVWRIQRDTEKFARALEFGMALPAARRRVASDLRGEDLSQSRVLAATIRLLDVGCFRIGSEEYARDHETFGISTLRREHLCVEEGRMVFSYPAKGSITRTMSVSDEAVAAVLAPLRRRRGGSGQLLAWREGGTWSEVHSAHVNAYLKKTVGPDFSAKDFRTWSATVYAASAFANIAEPPASKTGRRRAVVSVIKEVADYLGNTPAVCRASYIDPRVIDRFQAGETIADHGYPGSARSGERLRAAAEKGLIALIQELPEGQAAA